MKLNICVFLVSIFVFAKAEGFQRKSNFDSNWRFYKGATTNAELPAFNDSSWRILNLPHDWSVEPLDKNEYTDAVGPFSRQSPGSHNTGQTIGGEGWYRKKFTIGKDEADKHHILYFEGSYNETEVWVNGQKADYNVYGYTSFLCDITKFCKPAEQENTIAVHVVNKGVNSRWYSGSGLYRHVWMLTTSNIHLDEWETSIHTMELSDKSARLSINTLVANESSKASKPKAAIQVVSPEGNAVFSQIIDITTRGLDSARNSLHVQIPNPKAWTLETPVLYTAKISLLDGKKTIDEISIPFGIRTIAVSAQGGFLLNGKSIKLKGGCIHHDNGLLGAAAYDRAEERKVELLKQNGFNAIRTSHNPPSDFFLQACDRLGVLVICEAFDQWKEAKRPQDYHLYFSDWSAKDIRSMVLRIRNHPSVIMWSIGNEIRERGKDKGVEIAEYLRNEIRKYDTSRFITAGVNRLSKDTEENIKGLEKAFRHVDVAGYNYMWNLYEQCHETYPNQIMYGSETIAKEAAQNWDMVERHNYVIGDFVWTAMDYMGEAGLGSSLEIDPEENVPQFMGWPWYNAWCGDIDILGHKKPQSYYRDVVWHEKEITMAVEPPISNNKKPRVSFWGWPLETQSWTFPGRENDIMTVNIYSRSAKVRLYLNDSLIGDAATSNTYKAVLKVPYNTGVLKAVQLNGDKEGASVTLATTSAPTSFRLTADRNTITADGQNLAFVTIELTDNEGRLVLDNSRQIKIECRGNGELLASGNASPTDMESFRSVTPRLFNGRAMAIVKAGLKQGTITLKISSEGLSASEIEITTQK
jgi:beta-galactosidase